MFLAIWVCVYECYLTLVHIASTVNLILDIFIIIQLLIYVIIIITIIIIIVIYYYYYYYYYYYHYYYYYYYCRYHYILFINITINNAINTKKYV